MHPLNSHLGAHPILSQIPLVVSPYIRLPRAPTLPYTYRPLPSTLPPSSTGSGGGTQDDPSKPRYVVAQSGQAAHPSELIASYQALTDHLEKQQSKADAAVEKWRREIAARELADNRRRAPGWLDSQQRMLEPERQSAQKADGQIASKNGSVHELGMTEAKRSNEPDEGDELDRAFGVLKV